ncbi:hypothetical protein [Pseudomonas sp. GOM6]|uniref:hypothetical protein n=1 Tax=Pseudomonas sp. GOM6 TaxID=3036944 RepID=UPI00240A414E|nr:hypothetical protein [Pseudomonas sp. GOM6]MDG1581001.1 hypothetical protein [Pseudomonas sp. GOM6]
MALARSTNFIVGSSVIGLPFLWYEHPMEVLGPQIFYSLAGLILITALTGFALWAIDRE